MLPDLEIIDGSFDDVIRQYVLLRKPKGFVFVAFVSDKDTVVKPEVFVTANIVNFEYLASVMENLAVLYHDEAKRRCAEKHCPGHCDPDSLEVGKHHMNGMLCLHCGRAFCVQDGALEHFED